MVYQQIETYILSCEGIFIQAKNGATKEYQKSLIGCEEPVKEGPVKGNWQQKGIKKGIRSRFFEEEHQKPRKVKETAFIKRSKGRCQSER